MGKALSSHLSLYEDLLEEFLLHKVLLLYLSLVLPELNLFLPLVQIGDIMAYVNLCLGFISISISSFYLDLPIFFCLFYPFGITCIL